MLLRNGLLEDLELGQVEPGEAASFSSTSAEAAGDSTAKLRQLRRTGLLGQVGAEAQSRLLGGTLYEYSTAAPCIRASEVRHPSLWEGRTSLSFASSTLSEQGMDSAPRALEALQEQLSNFLQANEDVDEEFHRLLNGPSLNLDTTVVSTVGGLDTSTDSGALVEQDDMEALSHLLASELEQSQTVDIPNPTATTSFDEGFQSALEDHAGMASLNMSTAIWSDSEDEARTVFRSTVADTGQFSGGAAFAAVLRGLSQADPEALAEALTRSVRSILEMGTALAGGLSEAEIGALPKLSFQSPEEQQCSICLEKFQGGELLTSLPRCQHFFHMECIARWFQSSQQCPLCRQSHLEEEGTNGPPGVLADSTANGH